MRRSPLLLIGLTLASGLPPVVPVAAAQEPLSAASNAERPLGTPVPARVVTRIDDELRIEVDADVTIRYGTVVTVVWEIGGRTLDAGRAEVTSVDGRIATARITEGEPNERMKALVWVVSPEDYFEAGEAIFEGEWPDNPAGVRELRATAITLYMKAAVGGSPHGGARDRLREIRREWGFFDVAPDVQNLLGNYYSLFLTDSDGAPERPEDAVEWYRLAAAQGHALATRKLGHAYDMGQGVDEDRERAHELYDQAIELGDLDAMYSLAFHYASVNGHDSQADGIRALTRAAEAGHCRSFVTLVRVYFEGTVSPWDTGERDGAKGMEWYARGVQSGCLPWLGMTVSDVTAVDAEAYGLESVRGVEVNAVLEDSPAAGRLEVGDVILALDDQPIQNGTALMAALVRRDPGEEVELRVVRDGRERKVGVKLGGS